MDTLISSLSSAVDGEVVQLLTRWPVFVQKVSARFEEVLAEADSGLDALLSQHLTDSTAMSTAFGAVKSRVDGLDRKIDEAAERISDTLHELDDDGDLPDSDKAVLDKARDRVSDERDRLRDELERRWGELELRKNAQWARALYPAAQREVQTAPRCRECGGDLVRSVYWQAENITCTFCSAINSCGPGAATALYFGAGVHWLSLEAALQARRVADTAKARYQDARQPPPALREAWLQAEAAYWTVYYQQHAHLHPGFAAAYGSIEAAVQAKLSHHAND